MAVAVPRPDPAAHRAALLFERHYAAVLSYCIWRLRTHLDAEEAAQTTFARALGALRRGQQPRNERAWLVTIARNVCTTLGTAPHRALEVVGDVPHGVSPDGDDGLAPELEAALAALPEGQRRALLLREWHELSYREIASELGVSVGTVESWIFRARRSLASALGSAPRQLGLTGLLRWLGPSAGAKLAAATVLATAVVATERALETRGADDPVTPQRDTALAVTRARPAAPVAPVTADAPPARTSRARRAKSTAARVRAPIADSPRSPVVETAKTPEPAPRAPAPAPTRAADPAPAPGPPSSAPTPPAPPSSAPTPVQPPVQEPSLPVPEPQLPTLPVPAPTVPDLPVQPPALPVEPPALPVEPPALPLDAPQLPSTSDLPVDVPQLP